MPDIDTAKALVGTKWKREDGGIDVVIGWYVRHSTGWVHYETYYDGKRVDKYRATMARFFPTSLGREQIPEVGELNG